MDIKTFLELREAGYTVDQIKEYAALDQPAPAAEPKPEPKPEPIPEPAMPEDPSPDRQNDQTELLKTILATIRGQNVNNSSMPDMPERTAQDVLAEIINPKGAAK